MEKTRVTPKDFFLHIGLIAALYVSVISFINLAFTVIDAAFPNVEANQGYYNSSSISWPVAALMVVFPLYLVLSWLVRKNYVSMPESRDLWIRKWLVFLTLFIAGAVVVGDLIALLYTYLNGELITTAFILKVFTILLLSGAVFAYYVSDLRYIIPASRNRLYAIFAALVTIILIVVGFNILGSPRTQRLMRVDSQKVSDLQNIQWQIIDHWTRTAQVPETLALLNDSLSGNVVPTDPQTGESYEYRKVSLTSFELCAVFNLKNDLKQDGSVTPYMLSSKGVEDTNFAHEAGRACYTRTIDPVRYPPVKR